MDMHLITGIWYAVTPGCEVFGLFPFEPEQTQHLCQLMFAQNSWRSFVQECEMRDANPVWLLSNWLLSQYLCPENGMQIFRFTHSELGLHFESLAHCPLPPLYSLPNSILLHLWSANNNSISLPFPLGELVVEQWLWGFWRALACSVQLRPTL